MTTETDNDRKYNLKISLNVTVPSPQHLYFIKLINVDSSRDVFCFVDQFKNEIKIGRDELIGDVELDKCYIAFIADIRKNSFDKTLVGSRAIKVNVVE